MASVFLAVQTSLEREVALKVMSPALAANAEFASRFLIEGKITGKLQHPNLVTVYDIGSHNGVYYLAVEYIPGGTLKERMAEGGLSVAEMLDITSDIALGTRLRPPERLRASRREAGQHPVPRRRSRRARRFRHRQGHGRQQQFHRRRRVGRHAELHESRAGARGDGQRPVGPVQPRDGVVRNAGGPSAVPGRRSVRGRADACDASGAAIARAIRMVAAADHHARWPRIRPSASTAAPRLSRPFIACWPLRRKLRPFNSRPRARLPPATACQARRPSSAPSSGLRRASSRAPGCCPRRSSACSRWLSRRGPFGPRRNRAELRRSRRRHARRIPMAPTRVAGR